MGGSRAITEFIHSLSALFPEGEAFFIRSVKTFENDERVVSKSQLLKDIKGFISQEGQHTAEHVMYNNKIEKRYGHNMDKINLLIKLLFSIPEKYSISTSREYACLAVTCSLEHFTALLAELLLTTPQGKEMLDQMSPSHRTIWIWHAIEEIEHKAVTFDVFQAVEGSYLCRVYWHFLTTFLFLLTIVVLNIQFAINTGNYFDIIGTWQLISFLFISPGFLLKAVPLWAEYLRPGYHPWGNGTGTSSDRRNKVVLDALSKWQNELELITGKKRPTYNEVPNISSDDEAKVH